MGSGLYYIIAIVVSIIVACIFGSIAKEINEGKGYYGGFAWGFWLGVIGIIFVACRQPAYRSPRESVIRPVGEPTAPNTWKCNCGRHNAQYVSTCVCGLSKNQNSLQKPNNAASGDELKKVSLLKEYKELFDTGVITQEEFDAKKKSILSNE